ncbi:MAG TPA: TonB-dependent siderophore receptor [Sphingobium sp.]|uniref:TonB-dependent siderophore receptor n=1 Tax=Sphingobium sp. TaxID=1912891 RepID=UPI002ED60F3A
MKAAKLALFLCTAMTAAPVLAQQAPDAAAEGADRSDIIVTAARQSSGAGTKTDTPLIETPQPISIINSDTFEAQGSVSISDTLRYVAGVVANPYGSDSRVDSGMIRGISPQQFRDGMRDIFSYYASIRADPYNFSRVEVVRGPASVLFGSGSIGGLVNLVSKQPEFETRGEVSMRYGSFDRAEMLADVTGPITDNLAGRLVARVRNADTQTDYVKDDRVMFAPSLSWKAGDDTELTVIGLYQKDKGGSTAQFLPVVGTLYANPNGKLSNNTFIGKPGWDRYDGRLLEGTAILNHSFNDHVKLSLKARVIDSNVTYFTHYPNSYSNPANPYVVPDATSPTGESPDPAMRTIGLYTDGSIAAMNVFSTDNNVRFDFNTGKDIKHVLLAGVDYSWNHVTKFGGYGFEYIDIYNINYGALSNYGGGLPPGSSLSDDTRQTQLGFYVQDQIRVWDRVSVVLGARQDHLRTLTYDFNVANYVAYTANATSLRGGIIAEVVKGVSPFFSYTESFSPQLGQLVTGGQLKPSRGKQLEIGVKLHPDSATLVTVTGYHIKETNRPIAVTPTLFTQAESATSRGVEVEASRMLPGRYEIIANFSFNKAYVDGDDEKQLENVPKYVASIWGTKTVQLQEDLSFRLGTGVRYTGVNYSYGAKGAAFEDGLRTPPYVLVDALAELSWNKWRLSVNATNLLNKKFYAACLARGDCFIGAERNVYGTVTYKF